MAVSTATKLANQAKLSRQQAKAKLEESTRTGVNAYWQKLGKREDDVLERDEYKELVEILEPTSKPVDDGTMDEVSCQSAALKVCITHLSLHGRARTPARCRVPLLMSPPMRLRSWWHNAREDWSAKTR